MGPALGGPGGSGGGDKGGDLREGSGGSGGIPGLPKWLNLDVVVPVTATVIVVCVGILVVCVAVTRRKQPQMTPGLVAKKGKIGCHSRLMARLFLAPAPEKTQGENVIGHNAMSLFPAFCVCTSFGV